MVFLIPGCFGHTFQWDKSPTWLWEEASAVVTCTSKGMWINVAGLKIGERGPVEGESVTGKANDYDVRQVMLRSTSTRMLASNADI